MACPGYPECKNIKSIDSDTGVKCPKCKVGNIVAKKSKKGRTFYACDKYPECDFIINDEPLKELCPKCNKNLFHKKGKKGKVYCITENCGYEKVDEK